MRNDTSSPVLLLKKYIKSLSRFFVRIFQSIYSRIMVMDKYEQVFVVGLLCLTILLFVSPLMILSPNDDSASSEFVFLLSKIQLLKSTLVILFWLFLTLAWHLHTSFKNYVIEYIGFDRNPYLFSFFLLFSVLASVMSLWDMTNVFADYTTILRMHTMYYVIQIALILMVWFCLYMLIHQSQGGFNWHIVGYGAKKSHSSTGDDMQGLFSELKE